MGAAVEATVQQLRSFVALAEELHYGRTAARLRISGPSLSAQISSLEERVGAQLFRRTSRHVEITRQGEDLLVLARRATRALDDIRRWSRDHEPATSSVVVGVLSSSPEFSTLLAEAVRELPEVRWEVRRVLDGDPSRALHARDVDVLVLPAVDPPEADDLRVLPLWSEGRVLVTSSRHPLGGRTSVALAETDDEPFIGLGPHPAVMRWLISPRASGVAPHVRQVASSIEDLLDLCAAGVGVAIAGSSIARSHGRPDLRFVPIADAPAVPVSLMRLRDEQESAPALAALETIAQRLGAASATPPVDAPVTS